MRKQIFAAGILLSIIFWGYGEITDQPRIIMPQSTEVSHYQAITQPLQEKIQDAKTQNQEVVAWLRVEGTEIDGPVLQTGDNDYYLSHNLQREYDAWGSYYADYECRLGQREQVMIIYGHSLGDSPAEKHFSQIKHYQDPIFWELHPEIYFSIDEDETEQAWEVFAAGSVPATLEYLDPTPTPEGLAEILATMQQASLVDFPAVHISEGDQVLILSTCTSDNNRRFVVAAKRVKDGS